MTEETKTNYYNQYKGLINHTAFKYFQRTGFEFEELVAEGNYILCKCMYGFDAEKNVSFSTYLNSALSYQLRRYISKNNGISSLPDDWAVIDNSGIDVEKNVELFSAISGISNTAEKILDYIFTCPVERKKGQQKVISKDSIYKQFLGMGFGSREIIGTMDKISMTLGAQAL